MLSVVIPSLGGKVLNNTISSLNSGSIIPDEILISLPSLEYMNFVDVSDHNVSLINANCHGQVGQRIYGFKMAQYEYVLQLDDDLILDNKCIEILMDAIKKTKMSSFSPYCMNLQNNSAHHKKKSHNPIMAIFYWIVNGRKGYVPGTIAKAGINFGINKNDISEECNQIEVDWQPGGCVLHRRKNLIFNNYFPFSGKAYSEDLIHSFLLKSNNLKLVTCLDAFSYRDNDIGDLGIKDIINDFKARKYFVEMASLGKIRMYVFYWFVILKYIYFKARLIFSRFSL